MDAEYYFFFINIGRLNKLFHRETSSTFPVFSGLTIIKFEAFSSRGLM
jgi:hypothetical protein